MTDFTPPSQERLRTHFCKAIPLTPYQRHSLLWLIENGSERDFATLPPSVRSWVWEVRGSTTTDKSLHKSRRRWIVLPPHYC